jgi:opacity protein-like surface antigen
MKKVLFVVMLVCGVFVFSGLSRAESYLSGYVGVAIPNDTDTNRISGTSSSGEAEFSAGGALGFKAGRWFGKQETSFFGLGIDLNAQFPEADKLDISGTVNFLDADMEVYSVMLDALLRFPVGTIRPYVGGGAGWFFADIGSVGVLGVPFGSDDDNAFGWQVVGGIDVFIEHNVSLFAEYKYISTEFEFEAFDADYEVNLVYGGASFHF